MSSKIDLMRQIAELQSQLKAEITKNSKDSDGNKKPIAKQTCLRRRVINDLKSVGWPMNLKDMQPSDWQHR